MKQTLLVVSSLLYLCGTAHAQEAGQVGVSLGYPPAVGVVWHVTERVAVRPDISFSTGSTDRPTPDISILGESIGSGRSSSTTVTAGVSGLLYLWRWDKLGAYVSPRYSYSHLTSNSGSTFAIDSGNSNYTVTGSFGAQYQIHQRFAVFGETGFGYSHSTSTVSSTSVVYLVSPALPNIVPSVSTSQTVSRSWATRGGAGVIFYFK